MYAFNAIQLVALYAALPFIIQWCARNDCGAGRWACIGLHVVGSIFLVISSTRTLYEVDKVLRENS